MAIKVNSLNLSKMNIQGLIRLININFRGRRLTLQMSQEISYTGMVTANVET